MSVDSKKDAAQRDAVSVGGAVVELMGDRAQVDLARAIAMDAGNLMQYVTVYVYEHLCLVRLL